MFERLRGSTYLGRSEFLRHTGSEFFRSGVLVLEACLTSAFQELVLNLCYKIREKNLPKINDRTFENGVKNLGQTIHIIKLSTLISQLPKAASNPCKRGKKYGEDSIKRKINEWRGKRLAFLLISISSPSPG